MEVLIPADVEVCVVDELNARLPFPVGTSVPRPTPAEFGRVLAVGGAARDLVSDGFTVTVEGFAGSEGRAHDVCALMVAHVEAAARSGVLGGVPCYAARSVSLPANMPMPSVQGRYRFTATLTVVLRRAAA